jgi:hypothetical protein
MPEYVLRLVPYALRTRGASRALNKAAPGSCGGYEFEPTGPIAAGQRKRGSALQEQTWGKASLSRMACQSAVRDTAKIKKASQQCRDAFSLS